MIEVEKQQMRQNNFLENITIIQQNTQDFQNFLNQVKRKFTQNRGRSINIKQSVLQSAQSEQFVQGKRENSYNENNPQRQVYGRDSSRLKLINYYRSKSKDFINQTNPSKQKIIIRNLNRLNPYPNKSFQQEKIKKQQPSQLIELKSVKQLPSWLFQHIRKNNMGELKNRHLQKDQSINTKSQRYQQEQRIKQSNKLNSSQSINQYEKNIKPFQQSEKLKFSSSFQIRRLSKVSSNKNQKNKKIQDFIISQFEYPYYPQDQQPTEQAKIKVQKKLSNPKKSLYFEKSESYQNQRSKSFRIRQGDKVKNIRPNLIMIKNRLTTVSEQNPLNTPQKN